MGGFGSKNSPPDSTAADHCCTSPPPLSVSATPPPPNVILSGATFRKYSNDRLTSPNEEGGREHESPAESQHPHHHAWTLQATLFLHLLEEHCSPLLDPCRRPTLGNEVQRGDYHPEETATRPALNGGEYPVPLASFNSLDEWKRFWSCGPGMDHHRHDVVQPHHPPPLEAAASITPQRTQQPTNHQRHVDPPVVVQEEDEEEGDATPSVLTALRFLMKRSFLLDRISSGLSALGKNDEHDDDDHDGADNNNNLSTSSSSSSSCGDEVHVRVTLHISPMLFAVVDATRTSTLSEGFHALLDRHFCLQVPIRRRRRSESSMPTDHTANDRRLDEDDDDDDDEEEESQSLVRLTAFHIDELCWTPFRITATANNRDAEQPSKQEQLLSGVDPTSTTREQEKIRSPHVTTASWAHLFMFVAQGFHSWLDKVEHDDRPLEHHRADDGCHNAWPPCNHLRIRKLNFDCHHHQERGRLSLAALSKFLRTLLQTVSVQFDGNVIAASDDDSCCTTASMQDDDASSATRTKRRTPQNAIEVVRLGGFLSMISLRGHIPVLSLTAAAEDAATSKNLTTPKLLGGNVAAYRAVVNSYTARIKYLRILIDAEQDDDFVDERQHHSRPIFLQHTDNGDRDLPNEKVRAEITTAGNTSSPYVRHDIVDEETQLGEQRLPTNNSSSRSGMTSLISTKNVVGLPPLSPFKNRQLSVESSTSIVPPAEQIRNHHQKSSSPVSETEELHDTLRPSSATSSVGATLLAVQLPTTNPPPTPRSNVQTPRSRCSTKGESDGPTLLFGSEHRVWSAEEMQTYKERQVQLRQSEDHKLFESWVARCAMSIVEDLFFLSYWCRVQLPDRVTRLKFMQDLVLLLEGRREQGTSPLAGLAQQQRCVTMMRTSSSSETHRTLRLISYCLEKMERCVFEILRVVENLEGKMRSMQRFTMSLEKIGRSIWGQKDYRKPGPARSSSSRLTAVHYSPGSIPDAVSRVSLERPLLQVLIVETFKLRVEAVDEHARALCDHAAKCLRNCCIIPVMAPRTGRHFFLPEQQGITESREPPPISKSSSPNRVPTETSPLQDGQSGRGSDGTLKARLRSSECLSLPTPSTESTSRVHHYVDGTTVGAAGIEDPPSHQRRRVVETAKRAPASQELKVRVHSPSPSRLLFESSKAVPSSSPHPKIFGKEKKKSRNVPSQTTKSPTPMVKSPQATQVIIKDNCMAPTSSSNGLCPSGPDPSVQQLVSPEPSQHVPNGTARDDTIHQEPIVVGSAMRRTICVEEEGPLTELQREAKQEGSAATRVTRVNELVHQVLHTPKESKREDRMSPNNDIKLSPNGIRNTGGAGVLSPMQKLSVTSAKDLVSFFGFAHIPSTPHQDK